MMPGAAFEDAAQRRAGDTVMVTMANRATHPGNGVSRSAPFLPAALTFGLSAEDILRVNAARPSIRSIDAGESLYFQGDDCRTVYLQLDGWAFRHQSLADGRRQILDFALPGGVLGLSGGGAMTHSLEALTRCTFSGLARDHLCGLLLQVPVLALRFVELLGDAEARAFEHLTNVGRRSARERVASLLVELFLRARWLNPTCRTPRVTLPLMQSHVADALGLASETVCRVLAAMRRDDIVVLRAQKLDVLDIDRLAGEAGVDLGQASPPPAPHRCQAGSPTWSRLRPLEHLPACA
jgi:CRP-like cAMP-binding protein